MAISLKDLKNIDPSTLLDDRERQKCLEAFNAYDKNGSKRLEKEELRKVLEGKN